MNLKHLLSLGQTFFGIRSVPSPYRMTKENLLPDFGNIAQPAPSTKPAISASGMMPSEKQAVLEPFDRTDAVQTNLHQSTAPKAALSQAGGGGSTGDCGEGREPVVSSNPFAARNRKTKATRRLVQEELPIGEIRVVRNDLSEDDLKVVESRRPAANTAKAVSKPAVSHAAFEWNPFAAGPATMSKQME